MTYRRPDKVAAYEAAMKMIEADTALLNLPFGAGLAAIYKILRASTKLTGTDARQVVGKALRDARYARQVDILVESLGDCADMHLEASRE